MINLFKVRMSDKAPDAVKEVLESGYLTQGSKVDTFEDLLATELWTHSKPVTVNSCTTAIDLSLELCDVGPDDEVISTPQTCFASQIGAIHRHARIRWADIDPWTGLIDPDSVSKLVTSKTKAIIAVNWAGKVCNFGKLKKHGIPVIEDAAHSWNTLLLKNTERGDYRCFSFQAIKFLTCGDGGMIVCPTREKEHKARLLRWFGLDRTKNESFRCTQNIKQAGFKYHMNDINAAIGICNIPEARQSVIKTRQNSKFLIDNIKNKKIVLPEFDETTSFWLFSTHILGGKKKAFMDYLNANGIESSPVHVRNDLYDCTSKFKEKELPGVTSFTDTQVCIPNGWWLTDSELNHIVDTVNRF